MFPPSPQDLHTGQISNLILLGVGIAGAEWLRGGKSQTGALPIALMPLHFQAGGFFCACHLGTILTLFLH